MEFQRYIVLAEPDPSPLPHTWSLLTKVNGVFGPGAKHKTVAGDVPVAFELSGT